MPIHDAYARITPFELAFPGGEAGAGRMERIRSEAGRKGEGEGLLDPGRFLSLSSVAETLKDIRDPDAGGEEVQKHGLFLYHAFHFHEAGRPLYLLTTRATRYLVETVGPGPHPGGSPGSASEPASGPVSEPPPGASAPEPPPPPTSSGYLQLPRQLFWIQPSENATPEPVDGIFWAAPGGQRIALLVVSGMRDDRPGFSVVPLPAVPLDDAGTWLHARIRKTAPDFESTLPGGEMERLYSFVAMGEVLKLVARTFRYVEVAPHAISEPGDPDSERSGPPPTALTYHRIDLTE